MICQHNHVVDYESIIYCAACVALIVDEEIPEEAAIEQKVFTENLKCLFISWNC